MSNLFTQNKSGELLRQIKRALLQAVEYNFATAFFDLKIIREYFHSLEAAVENGVPVKFVFSDAVSQEEFLAVKSAISNKWNDFISFESISLFNEEEKEKLFRWISEEKIKFKVAFMHESGIFHGKLGYIKQKNGLILEWSGSANHTYNGLTGEVNYEYTNLEFSDEKTEVSKTFDGIWNGKLKDLFVVDIDKVLVSELALSAEGKLISPTWIYEKWGDALFLMSDKIYYCNSQFDDAHDIIEYFIPAGRWSDDGRFKVTKADDVNKLRMLSWIQGNKECFVSSNLQIFLEDNISKMQKLVELGLKIKNDWEEVKLTDEYQDFLTSISTLKRTPFDLQVKQAYFAAKLQKSLNFSVPGTGKSMVSLTTFKYLKENNLSNRLFIIAPTSAHSTWEYEFEVTFGYKPRVFNIANEKATKDEKWRILYDLNKKKYDMIIMHFSSAAIYYEAFKEVINEKDFFIIDEAHYIKNEFGSWGQTIRKLGKKSKYSLLLTGTPAPNGIEDINNMLEITYGDAFLNFFVSSSDQDRLLTALHMKITYEDLKMPFKQINHFVNYSLTFEQKLINEELNRKLSLANGKNALEILIRRIQNLSSPNLIKSENFSIDESPKLKELLRLIEPGKNVVIWANFVCSINSIAAAIKKQFPHINIFKYYGEASKEERVESIDAYKRDGGILIANPQTLAEAVSLHKNTDYTMYFEFGFNLVHWIQSRNRTFRYGMEKDMDYYVMTTSDDKLDEFILRRLTEKEDFQNNVISYNSADLEDETLRDIKLFIEGLM